MAETSDRDVQARCRRVIENFRRWAPDEPQAPRVSDCLNDGHSNVALLLTGRQARWVLRLTPPEPSHGVDRRRELLFHERAAAAGLAPRVLFHDLTAGILITAFVEASSEEAAVARTAKADPRDDLQSLAALLRAIHKLNPALPSVLERDGGSRLDTPAYLREWRSSLNHDPLESLDCAEHKALAACSERLAAAPAENCLCHNDLIRANRVHDGQHLLAIDWEYASLGDPFFDLANAAWELASAQQVELLRHYLGRREAPLEARRFADQRCLQAAIACCWHAVRGQAALASKARERLRNELEHRNEKT